MHDPEPMSLEQIRAFLSGAEAMEFAGVRKHEVYGWLEQLLRQHDYPRRKKPEKGLLRQYVAKMTGLGRAQVTRLIGVYGKTGEVKARLYRRNCFAARYTAADLRLLAYVDEMHGNLSGPATCHILHREYRDYGQAVYERLARLSPAQLYRFRKTAECRKQNTTYQPTRPTSIAIGERRKPRPEGRPGYLRVDTVHQGDEAGIKGVYHINAVDEVTQWEVVGATPQISEAFLLPVLAAMLEQFPFPLLGFHSDNGSEFINYRVAGMLNKLLIEQTKSRPRHSNDNGLVESKNGAVIRKHIGWGHIAAQHASEIDQFHREHLNPYLNFRRPCGIPTIVTNEKGQQRSIYQRWATPWEMLREKLLQPGNTASLRAPRTIAALDAIAAQQSDTDAARDLQQAKRDLLGRIKRRTA